MWLLTRKGYLIEEQGMSYLTDTDPGAALRPRASDWLISTTND
jgi:hypothetical protein